MKKTFTSLVVSIVAIASFGGNIVSLAHAQTATVITPEEAAALQVQLDTLKTKLLELQAEQSGLSAQASPAPESAPANTKEAAVLSPSDTAALQSAFTALTAVLTSLETQITHDPQFLATHGSMVAASLGNIANALLMTSKALPASPIASAPSTSSGGTSAGASVSVKVNPSPSESPTPLVGATEGTSPATPSAANNAAGSNAEAAQASSVFSAGSLNWPLILVVLLAVAAIALWLWWPSDEEEHGVAKKGQAPSPKAPVVKSSPAPQPTITVAAARGGNMPTIVTTPARPSGGAPTPLSSVVATPMPKPGMPQMDPKRKSA